jgi:hypothetical protein
MKHNNYFSPTPMLCKNANIKDISAAFAGLFLERAHVKDRMKLLHIVGFYLLNRLSKS